MSPIGTVGFVLSIVAGLMLIVGAMRMVKRTDVTLAVIFFATTLMIGVGSLVPPRTCRSGRDGLS